MLTGSSSHALSDATYGSDEAGMVCAYAFMPGHPARSIGPAEAARLLGDPAPAEFLWLHFAMAHTSSTRWLRQHVSVPESFFERHDQSSTRLEVEEDGLSGVLNDMPFFHGETATPGTVALHVNPRMILSGRTTPLRAIDRLRAAVRAGEVFATPAEVLAHLLRDQADVLAEIVRDATRQVDEIEDRILNQQRASRPRLGVIRRLLVRVQRLLAPEPAALFRLLNRPPRWLTDEDVAELRRSAEELAAAVTDAAALVERVRLLQEELTALLSERTNQTLFVLTVVTVLALPMTIIPGLFGMNVGGVPFAASSGGFWLVLVLLLAIVGGAAVLARRWHDRS